ncbi:MAG: kelch repeat-containing protein [Cryomorphaceae bacterium]
MLRLANFIALLFLCSLADSQTWTEISPFPGAERDDGVAFSIGGQGYAGTGRDLGFAYTNDFYAYSPTLDQWMEVSPLPAEGRQYCGRFAIADTGYVVCGFGQSGYLNELWAYHPESDTWTQKASFPGAPRSSPIAFSIAGKAYVGTGRNGDEYFEDFWEYNPELDSWTQLDDFPGGRRFEAIGMDLGSFGYAGLGRLQDEFFANDWWQFNPISGEWTRKADFTGETRYYSVEFVLGGKGFVAAGQDQNLDYLNRVYEYSSFDDTWSETSPLPSAPLKGAFAFSIESSAYLGTGITSSDLRLSEMYRFDLPLSVSNLKVYPNPAVDRVVFAWEGESPERVDIFNIDGALVSSSILENQINFQQSLTSYPAGGYVANFTWKDGKTLSKTFIKVK